jgi:hypothetical protein
MWIYVACSASLVYYLALALVPVSRYQRVQGVFDNPALTCALCCHCRGLTEVESDEPPPPFATLAQERDVRIGLIPVSYDRERRMTTYYWFLAIPASEKVGHQHMPITLARRPNVYKIDDVNLDAIRGTPGHDKRCTKTLNTVPTVASALSWTWRVQGGVGVVAALDCCWSVQTRLVYM